MTPKKITSKDIKPLLQIFYYILMKIIHKQNQFLLVNNEEIPAGVKKGSKPNEEIRMKTWRRLTSSTPDQTSGSIIIGSLFPIQYSSGKMFPGVIQTSSLNSGSMSFFPGRWVLRNTALLHCQYLSLKLV